MVTLPSECFVAVRCEYDGFNYTFYLLKFPQVKKKSSGFRSGERGNRNPLPIILSLKAFCK
jgi:hypothetical protein